MRSQSPAHFLPNHLLKGKWIAVLLCAWLTANYLTTVHSLEHPLASDLRCQLCVSGFNHTPVLPSTEVLFTSQHSVFHVFAEVAVSVPTLRIHGVPIRAPPVIA